MKKFWLAVLIGFLGTMSASAEDQPQGSIDINQTVVKMPIEDEVTPNDAIDSMKLRANRHNMMFVSHQPLSQQLQKMGLESRRLEIFQFCDPVIAGKMVEYNSIFAAYMPCRIALVEEPDGIFYLMTLDLDMLIQGAELPPELHELAQDVNNKLLDIMEAGATGDL